MLYSCPITFVAYLYYVSTIAILMLKYYYVHFRGRSRVAATYKMKCLVIIVKGFQTLTIIAKRSILNDAAALDPSLLEGSKTKTCQSKIPLDKYMFKVGNKNRI